MKTKVQTYRFSPSQGAAEEHILVSIADASLRFQDQLEAVLKVAGEAEGVQFRRFFLSDPANQAPLLQKALTALPQVPTSLIGQAPLDGSKIALWLYCAAPGSAFRHYWDSALTAPEGDSHQQMEDIFGQLEERLARRGMDIPASTVRTWIFVRDVDTNYAGVVTGRREFFGRIGLTPSTHFIASTGIEGSCPHWRNKVVMDAYSIGGLQEGQMAFLYALDHLSPTYDYGVTFERGTTVTYGDRRHIFISGTASIDAKGNVMYEGDAAAQTGRMLENIDALLSEAGAGFGDLAMAIVYLRDRADYPLVREAISKACPTLHALYVHAPVCRPSWLVEMECIAITPAGDARYPKF